MSKCLVFLALFAVAAAMSWEEFKLTFSKSYDSPSHEAERKAIFLSNMEFVRSHNNPSYTVAMNAFGDLTVQEFVNKMAKKTPFTPGVYNGPTLGNVSALPPSQDWRTSNCIGPVPNQGQCGAVWAIVAVDLISAYNCLQHHHTLVPLSLQDVLDCTPGSQGCSGGLADLAFQYCVDKGIDTAASYPPSGQQGTCHHDQGTIGAQCVSWHKISPPGNETDLTQVLAYTGPVACGIDASQSSFQFYQSGVYNDPTCTDQIDHVVLNVGYGTQSGKDYYILQNSWGTAWGMNGYMLLARNKHNMCGIATDASYVVVK